MVSLLFQHHENLDGIVEDLLDNVSADGFDKSTIGNLRPYLSMKNWIVL